MRLRKPGTLVKLFAMLILATLVASCTTTGSSVVTSEDSRRVACQSFAPISWSAKDTTLTVAQVKEHNASGKAICGWGAK